MTASGSGTHTYPAPPVSPAPPAPDDRPSPPVGASPTGAKTRRKLRVLVAAAIIAALAVAGAWAVLSAIGGAAVATDLGPTAAVTRGPLVYSVTESGEVEAERRKVIGNELRYPAIIKSVVPEGTAVKEGDTVIEFECKELIDDIDKGKITVTAAQNAYTQARENLTLKQKEVDAAVRTAGQAVVNADSDLKKYIEIDGPTKLDDANSAIATAKQDLLLAQAKLDFKLKVNADEELKSPFSKNDIEADKLGVFKLELAKKKAENARVMLMKYDHPRQILTYEIAVENAKLALARAKLEASSGILKADADLAAAKATFEMQDRLLKDLLEDAGKMVVKADKEGLVVYDTGSSRWYSSDVRVEVGAKINPRQQLMIIPDLTTLQIRTKVYEAIIDDVRPGLPAHVKLENKPDQTFSGKIIRVGVLPDSQNRWLNPGVKVFSVIVRLDQEIEGLRPGMSSEVEIELAKLDNVLSVPIASVYSEQDKTFCYRVEGSGGYKRAPVQLGRMNSTCVQILSGLQAGDRVLLAPPSGEQVEMGKPKDEEKDDQAKDMPPGMPGGKGEAKAPPNGPDEGKGGAKAPNEGRQGMTPGAGKSPGGKGAGKNPGPRGDAGGGGNGGGRST
jgi:multidrug efflux pump subunit AcrA (membrane-fusion protein)